MVTLGGLLASLAVVGLLLLYVWSVFWAASDARRRERPGWLGGAVVGILIWPIGLLIWLAFRPRAASGVAVSEAWKPILVLTAICLLSFAGDRVPTGFGVLTDFRESKAYDEAVRRLYADHGAVERLGEPLRASRLVSGSLDIHRSPGEARLNIPIRGSKQNGSLQLKAAKRAGDWLLEEAVVDVDGEVVDLMAMRSPDPSAGKATPEIDWRQAPSDLAPALPIR